VRAPAAPETRKCRVIFRSRGQRYGQSTVVNLARTGREYGLALCLNNPQSRPVRGNGHGNGQIINSHWHRPYIVYQQSADAAHLRPPLRRVLNMSAFDPIKIRKAVEEFTPRRPEKFHELFAAKDVIVELRQKRASYRSIADLLTRHCLPTCKTSVALFCHKILGETTRTRGRPAREHPSESETPAYETPVIAPRSMEAGATAQPNGNEISSTRTRGPRIAQVRMLKPQST